MIDSHCHLDDAVFDDDRGEMLVRAFAAGVSGMLIPAIRPRTWPALAALPARYPKAPLAIALGVHPQVVPELDAAERALATDATALAAALAAARTPETLAVGECGLDGGTADRAAQEDIFRAHVRAARELGLPLVVHVLRAHDAVPRILREERARDVGGVLHSYSGPPEMVPVYRDLGFAFSFAGAVTRANARRPLLSAQAVPDELLLTETDAPDQTPGAAGAHGRSEPAMVVEIVAALARIRGQAAADVVASTAANARRLFKADTLWRATPLSRSPPGLPRLS
ncbi:MAG TPA: TatD family hydrolase [Kofleriaceae bacterium]|nr:TatD family hydrolase [Kofleriaceae bacterium]